MSTPREEFCVWAKSQGFDVSSDDMGDFISHATASVYYDFWRPWALKLDSLCGEVSRARKEAQEARNRHQQLSHELMEKTSEFNIKLKQYADARRGI